MTTRVLVYGSCVARDTVHHVAQSVEVCGYVARQSLISAVNPPAEVVPRTARLASRFQRRMVEADFASDFFPRLRAAARSVDVVLVDLVDERHGVHRLPRGSWVTRSDEFVQAGGTTPYPGASGLVELGTERHLGLWSRGWERFIAQVSRWGIADAVSVVRAPFAETCDDGSPVPPYRGVAGREWDRRYAPYYTRVEASGVRIVDVPPNLAVSTARHRWGPAPYHYVDEAYAHLARALGLGR